ncbi:MULTISPECIES: energy transducer TonB family protein [Pseudomonas]|jgi:protein TonB|uniref:Energy transducer TonB n=1 Tax=Pseudomonas simiae TaxID=321846 RepID=A0A1N7U9K9_9PSED|nr:MULTISPECIES: energy transducer TonB [Pseudomonas]MBD8742699.1 energy transducer TonB [Pseudomonas fluorescens]PHX41855.1 energy transducer TonB [Pseudomonas sp. NZIPFR-PS2]AIB35741.1 energy transducer TonB [Pseudomonas simiae]AJP51514.1 TonB domain-containing protein [Pseudomonas simiae]MBC3966454.1 energy transducer TonB [Pseudomonas simiae]
MYVLFRARQLLGSVPALIALVLIAVGIQSQTLKVEPVYDESAVELALVEPEPEVIPEPVVEQAPPPPVIEDEEAEPAPPPPPPKPLPKPKHEPKPKPVPKPVVAQPTPAPAPPPVTAKPAPAAVAQVAPTPAPPAPPKVDGQALEGGYLKGLRNELDTYKQYPTGRQASLERPTGEVVVWLLVDRQGRVLDSGLQTQASSMLLNRAATNSLRRIKQVKPFPEQAFGGRNEQRFTATFNYSVQ